MGRLIKWCAPLLIAVACSGETADSLFTRGEAATHDVSRYAEAVVHLEAFLRDFPGDPRADVATQALARVYQSQGLSEKAVATYGNLIRRFPQSRYADQAQFMIGYIHDLQGRKEEAVAAYRKVLEGYPASELADDARISIANIDKPLETWIQLEAAGPGK
jgi:TolA-binding protein